MLCSSSKTPASISNVLLCLPLQPHLFCCSIRKRPATKHDISVCVSPLHICSAFLQVVSGTSYVRLLQSLWNSTHLHLLKVYHAFFHDLHWREKWVQQSASLSSSEVQTIVLHAETWLKIRICSVPCAAEPQHNTPLCCCLESAFQGAYFLSLCSEK